MDSVQPNAYVTLAYTLRGEDGELLETNEEEGGEPLGYVHGYGMLVPGLEVALLGVGAGQRRQVVVAPADGFGEYDDELVVEVDLKELPSPDGVAVGDELVAEAEDGEETVVRVVEVRDGGAILDANHPLAGATLHYDVRVVSVREATPGELAAAAANFEAAEETAGALAKEPTPGGDLIPLRRR